MFPQQSAAFLQQETSCLNAIVTMRCTYDESCKSVPDGLKPQECKCTKLREPLPVPYAPNKDEVQEEVAKLRNLEIKTTLEKDTTLIFPVWNKNGTRKAFLMHVTTVLDAIKKRGTFKDYKKAEEAYVEAKKAAESAEAGLALLDSTSTESRKNCKKKALVKAKEATKEALAKTQETKSEAKEAEEATNMTKNSMKTGFKDDLEKAKKAMEDAKGAMITATSKMFTFYLNLLSPKSKYSWNKIVSKQTESGPICEPTRCLSRRPKGNVLQVVLQLHHVSPSHCIPHQCS